MGYAITFGFQSTNPNKSSKRLSKTQLNIFSTCLIMVAAFLICWSFYIGTMLNAAFEKGNIRALVSDWYYIAETLLEVNSSINPIIYAVRLVNLSAI